MAGSDGLAWRADKTMPDRDTPSRAYAWPVRRTGPFIPMSLPATAWPSLPGLEALPPAGAWVSSGLVALAAATACLALWWQARDRRRMRELLERLERLEQALHEPVPEAAPRPAPAGSGEPLPEVSADVLRGRTSWVRQLVTRPPAPFQPLADQAVVQVHAALGRNLTPAELADALCVSLRTLERGLALTLGCSPRQLILAVKMREAFRLLRQGARVGEVADRLGFASAFHFSRRFKDFYHLAPSELRPANGRPTTDDGA